MRIIILLLLVIITVSARGDEKTASSTSGSVQTDCDDLPPGLVCSNPNASRASLLSDTNPPAVVKGDSKEEGTK